MIIGTVRSEEARVFDSEAGYHQFHNEAGEAYGSFLVFWHLQEFAHDEHGEEVEEQMAPGWYWVAEFPGCMPDGEPSGPFASSRDAMYDADEYHPDNVED